MVDPIKNFFNEAYDLLFHKVTGYIVARCSDLSEVEDIVQEVFIDFYKLIERKGAGYIKNTEAIVMQIAKTKLFRHYKFSARLKNRVPLIRENEEGEYPETIKEDVDIEDSLINRETVREVWELLRKKPLEIQKIFALYYYCDMKISEISKELGLNESGVKRRLFGTLKEIRNVYLKEGEAL